MVREPEEIPEREHEIVVARVASVDVAKASAVVCTRVPREDEPGPFVTRVHPVDTTTNAILELADYLVGIRNRDLRHGETEIPVRGCGAPTAIRSKLTGCALVPPMRLGCSR